MRRSVLIFDSFLEKPEELLAEFEKTELTALPGFNRVFTKSKPSVHRKFVNGKIELAIGNKVNFGETADPGGEFRCTTVQENIEKDIIVAVHTDMQWDWNFIVYLSSENEAGGGTGLFRHKNTGLDGLYDSAAVEDVLKTFGWTREDLDQEINRDARDPSKWNLVSLMGAKFNRLAAFDAKLFHSHMMNFNSANKSAKRITYVSYGTNV